MLPVDSVPVLGEAVSLRAELRRIRRAIALDGDASRAEHERDLVDVSRRLDALAEDPANRGVLEAALDARAASLRVAVSARRAAKVSESERSAAGTIVSRAVQSGRPLTASESDRVRELRARRPDETWMSSIDTVERRDAVLEALGTLRIREARQQLRDGLLQTAQMRGIIREAVPALRQGDPVLLVGETGGAKTALAEHLARAGLGREPELVSGYGDIMSAQVIGTHELRAEAGATVSVFTPGPLLRAMHEGRPVILDEVNAMPPEFLKRLNRILQLRPGDSLNVQENAGRPVTIAPGFAILATANEQTPHRYRGLDRLSAELVNRFGANAYRVHYPDTGCDYAAFPAENGLLAVAAVTDRHGALPDHLPPDALIRAARAAFISQQVFAGEHGAGFADYVSSEREIDGRPGLEESVIAPRTLVAILRKVAGSAGEIDLDRAFTRFVEGIMHREDRRVLALILEGQGFRIA
ncbi:AAA family ATPase [Leucobacter sp. USCH14]|uniref:AAA family ATPase n=1 Tax=Leucobacter sp. USCH14 TaxID=3024838 RepID=UPI0030B315B8